MQANYSPLRIRQEIVLARIFSQGCKQINDPNYCLFKICSIGEIFCSCEPFCKQLIVSTSKTKIYLDLQFSNINNKEWIFCLLFAEQKKPDCLNMSSKMTVRSSRRPLGEPRDIYRKTFWKSLQFQSVAFAIYLCYY